MAFAIERRATTTLSANERRTRLFGQRDASEGIKSGREGCKDGSERMR